MGTPDLERFVEAQAPVYGTALAELRAGRKRSHWMWFVFPQIEGLGRSPVSRRYALRSLEEARAYLGHPVLGPRLTECTEAVLSHAGARTAQGIFGSPDDLKFHSSMTLFHRAAPEEALFRQALEAFFAGEEDEETLVRINGLPPRT
jgi:uncharacterized protein (DUF1810 family)